jgi:hypothetical protein
METLETKRVDRLNRNEMMLALELVIFRKRCSAKLWYVVYYDLLKIKQGLRCRKLSYLQKIIHEW